MSDSSIRKVVLALKKVPLKNKKMDIRIISLYFMIVFSNVIFTFFLQLCCYFIITTSVSSQSGGPLANIS